MIRQRDTTVHQNDCCWKKTVFESIRAYPDGLESPSRWKKLEQTVVRVTNVFNDFIRPSQTAGFIEVIK